MYNSSNCANVCMFIDDIQEHPILLQSCFDYLSNSSFEKLNLVPQARLWQKAKTSHKMSKSSRERNIFHLKRFFLFEIYFFNA